MPANTKLLIFSSLGNKYRNALISSQILRKGHRHQRILANLQSEVPNPFPKETKDHARAII